MTIYDEIIKLRDSTSNSLRRVNNFPKLIPYGFMYTATLVAGGTVLSEVFKFNPHTYAGESMGGVLKKLVEKAGLIEGTLGSVECTEGVLDYLLTPEYDDEDERSSCRKTWYNGVTVSDDRRTVNIPGTAIRYTVVPPPVEGKRRRSSYPDWKTLDTSVLVVVNAVDEWKDPSADAENKKKLDEWLVDTAGDVSKALEHLKELDKLVGKAMTNK